MKPCWSERSSSPIKSICRWLRPNHIWFEGIHHFPSMLSIDFQIIRRSIQRSQGGPSIRPARLRKNYVSKDFGQRKWSDVYQHQAKRSKLEGIMPSIFSLHLTPAMDNKCSSFLTAIDDCPFPSQTDSVVWRIFQTGRGPVLIESEASTKYHIYWWNWFIHAWKIQNGSRSIWDDEGRIYDALGWSSDWG